MFDIYVLYDFNAELEIKMLIRKANKNDLSIIVSLYDTARELLKHSGIDQWQDGYPNEESAIIDMNNSASYVIEDNGHVIGTACIDFGIEPTYNEIHEGEWKSSANDYGFLHRVAVSPSFAGKGLAKMFFDELQKQAIQKNVSSLRCDTHRQNTRMQKTLEKNGFEYCGIIYLENGDERFAYEKVLD